MRLWPLRRDQNLKTGTVRSSARGSILLQVVVASGVATFVILGLSQVVVQMHQREAGILRKLVLFDLRSEIINLLTNEAAWSLTVANADNIGQANSACLRGVNGDDGNIIDCFGKSGVLTIVNSNNEVVVDPANPTGGFDRQGAVCNTFDADTPDLRCLTQISAQWFVDCPAACSTRNPPLRIEVRFIHQGTDMPINTKNLGFVLRR